MEIIDEKINFIKKGKNGNYEISDKIKNTIRKAYIISILIKNIEYHMVQMNGKKELMNIIMRNKLIKK